MQLHNLLGLAYESIVAGKEKAVTAFIVAGAVSFAAAHLGYHVSNGLQQLASAALVGLLAHLAVYLTANRE